MKPLDPEFLARSKSVFRDSAALTLADVRGRAASDATLRASKRRDLASAISRIEEWSGMSPHSLEAGPPKIRSILEKLSAVKLGVSEKTLANVRSLVCFAIRRYAAKTAPLTKRFPIDAQWTTLLDQIQSAFQRQALYRLATYCSVMQIGPAQVAPETLVGLHAALEAEEIVKNPRSIIKNTIANWNRSKRRISEWPDVVLSSPFRSEPFCLALGNFPQAFQEDIAKWKERAMRADPFDDQALARRLRDATVEHRILQFRLVGSALVRSGTLPLSAISRLSVLVQPDHFKSAMRFLWQRRGERLTAQLFNLARSLRLVGKHYCNLNASELSELDRLCRRLDPGKHHQMTDRNRVRLAQFDDPRNVARLLGAPAAEAKRAKRERNPLRAAKAMDRAAALALLVNYGLRAKTLRSLELCDFHWLPNSKCKLYVPPEKLKSNRPLEFELDAGVATIIRDFKDTYRSRLPGSDGPFLFPGIKGGPRSKNAIYEAVATCMEKKFGLKMNPHLFRHALAKIVIEADETTYLSVSRVLGHASPITTDAHYFGTESKAAGKQIDRVIGKLKRGGS